MPSLLELPSYVLSVADPNLESKGRGSQLDDRLQVRVNHDVSSHTAQDNAVPQAGLLTTTGLQASTTIPVLVIHQQAGVPHLLSVTLAAVRTPDIRPAITRTTPTRTVTTGGEGSVTESMKTSLAGETVIETTTGSTGNCHAIQVVTLVPGTAPAVRPTGGIVPATATLPGGLRTQTATEYTPAGVVAIVVSGRPGTTGAVMAVGLMTDEGRRTMGEGRHMKVEDRHMTAGVHRRMVGEVRHPTAGLRHSMMGAARHRTTAGGHLLTAAVLSMMAGGHRMTAGARHTPAGGLHMTAEAHRTTAGGRRMMDEAHHMMAEGLHMTAAAHPTTVGGHHMTAEGRRMTAAVRLMAAGGTMREAILVEGMLGASLTTGEGAMTASTGSGTAGGVLKRREVAMSGETCTGETSETAATGGTHATCGMARASLVTIARVMSGGLGCTRMGMLEMQLTARHVSATETLGICGRALTGWAMTLAVSGGGTAVRRITARRQRLRR